MNKEIKNKMVPKLRFEEFRESGEWVYTKVEENCLVKGRIGYRGYTTEDLVEKDKGALVLGGKHIQNHALDLSEPTFLTWDKYYESPEIMAEIGDIIFSQRGTLGDCAIIEKGIGPATINPSMVLLKNITCNAKFLFYSLIGDGIQKEVQKNRSLGAIPMLSQKQIKEFLFLSPTNPKEQQKIASCLSSLDDLITAHNQKLEVLKAHKKGLMQQLFPVEGEIVPKLRFKEFKDSGEWEEKMLGDVVTFSSGNTPSKDIPEYWGGDIPWISASSMHEIIIEKSDLNITPKALENGASMAKEGEILILVRGSMLFKRIPLSIASRVVAFNQDVKTLRLKKDISNFFLLYQLIASEPALLQKVSATGIGAGKIDTSELQQFQIRIPSISEQQKIASCLSSLDEMISAQGQKIEALKTHKKGLMQGLFPNTNGTETHGKKGHSPDIFVE